MSLRLLDDKKRPLDSELVPLARSYDVSLTSQLFIHAPTLTFTPLI